MKNGAPGKILITRPEPQAQDFAKDLQGLGIETIISPVLEIVPLAYDRPEAAQVYAIVFTSINGVHFFEPQDFYGYPVFCVGTRTAEAARALGYKVIASAKNSVDLVRIIEEVQHNIPRTHLLYVRGADIAFDFPSILPKISWSSVVVYGAEFCSFLSLELKQALKEHSIFAVTFFSKRTAEIFMNRVVKENLENTLANCKVLCISQSVLEYVRPALWKRAYVSKTPDREGMVSLIKTLGEDIIDE